MKQHRTTLGIIFLIVFIDLVGFGIVIPILPLYGEKFGPSALTLGLLMASYSAMQFIFAPILGGLSDRVGRRPVLLVSLVGSVIGSGIFLTPQNVAAAVQIPGVMIFVWILTGLLTLAGALTNAEIASEIPRAGGQYVFFRVLYGDLTAFLYGWPTFTVYQTGSIAAIAIDYYKLGLQTGDMIHRVLKGADPATMPVETLKEFELHVNLKAAAEMGVTLPEDFVARAAKVYK